MNQSVLEFYISAMTSQERHEGSREEYILGAIKKYKAAAAETTPMLMSAADLRARIRCIGKMRRHKGKSQEYVNISESLELEEDPMREIRCFLNEWNHIEFVWIATERDIIILNGSPAHNTCSYDGHHCNNQEREVSTTELLHSLPEQKCNLYVVIESITQR